MWGMSEAEWFEYLEQHGMKDVVIKYYKAGITHMESENREVVYSNPYVDLVNSKLGKDVMQRAKTIDFYRIRLNELEG